MSKEPSLERKVTNLDVRNLEGKLKTYMDSIVAPTFPRGAMTSIVQDQNKAIKDMIQMLVWDWFTSIDQEDIKATNIK